MTTLEFFGTIASIAGFIIGLIGLILIPSFRKWFASITLGKLIVAVFKWFVTNTITININTNVVTEQDLKRARFYAQSDTIESSDIIPNNLPKIGNFGKPTALKYIHYGMEHYNNSEYDSAISAFDEAIKLDKNSAEAYYNRSNAYDKKDDIDKAVYDLNKAIKLKKLFYAEKYATRGNVRKIIGNYKGANEDLHTALNMAEQQGNKTLADQIRIHIADLPTDSDS